MTIKEDNSKILSLEEAGEILSDTLRDVSQGKTTLRHAMVVSRLALALSKVIEIGDLKNRVELIEQVLKKRK